MLKQRPLTCYVWGGFLDFDVSKQLERIQIEEVGNIVFFLANECWPKEQWCIE